MRYIFYCENCGFVGSDENNRIDNPIKCPECATKLIYTGISQDEWRSKTQEEKTTLKQSWADTAHQKGKINQDVLNLRHGIINHMLTSGYNFEGYKITSYNGIISGEIVIGTGFLSEITASINDFTGSTSEEFSSKMTKAKDMATTKMIKQSIRKGGNAIIGITFNYTPFGNNMIGVSANGTCVNIEKTKDL